MQFVTKTVAAIAGLGVVTVGALALANGPTLSQVNRSPQLSQPGWQTPMNRGQMPMHQGPGPGRQGAGHHGMMMMQANSEFEFLSLMIPHHQEAIANAQRLLAYSDRPEMKEFAQDIIDVQSAEVEQMEAWLDAWYPGQSTNLTYTPMMRDLSQLEGDALDRAFLTDMIRHHMGAVMMSQRLVNHGLVEHQPVQPFAQNIANTQRQEIWQMQGWLQDWYGVSGMPGPRHRGRIVPNSSY